MSLLINKVSENVPVTFMIRPNLVRSNLRFFFLRFFFCYLFVWSVCMFSRCIYAFWFFSSIFCFSCKIDSNWDCLLEVTLSTVIYVSDHFLDSHGIRNIFIFLWIVILVFSSRFFIISSSRSVIVRVSYQWWCVQCSLFTNKTILRNMNFYSITTVWYETNVKQIECTLSNSQR